MPLQKIPDVAPPQLLTCYNTAAGDSAALPPDGLLISPLLGCPLGWQVGPARLFAPPFSAAFPAS